MRACTYENCDKIHIAQGLCIGHYYQVRRGSPLTPLRPYGDPRPCTETGCEDNRYGLGLCNKHYHIKTRYGAAGVDTQLYRIVNGFDVVQVVDGMSACWLWRGAHTPLGYGRFGGKTDEHKGRFQYVHRYAYKTWVGPLLPHLEIDHLCRQHPCINPEHLEQVTHSVNCQRGVDYRRTLARQP